MKGKVSKTGYKKNSPDVENDFNVIPSGNLTMRGVHFPVTGIDNYGNVQHMLPGVNSYTFPGSHVLEIPHRQFGGDVGGLSPETAQQALIEGHIMGQELSDVQRSLLAQIAGTDEDGNLLDDEGNVDNGEEEMRRGGQHNKHKGTSKNIQSSVNELFLRNFNAYGKAGKHVYNPKAEEGGETMDNFLDYMKKGGFMGIHESHKGWCTPLSNPHCTGARRRLAITLKKHHGFHQEGGENLVERDYDNNFDNPFFQMGGSPQFKNRQEHNNYYKKLGYQSTPTDSNTFYNPKQFQYVPNEQHESGYEIKSLDPNVNIGAYNALPSEYTFNYQTPQKKWEDIQIPKPVVRPTSNRTAVSFGSFGPGSVSYKDTATGVVTHYDNKGQVIQPLTSTSAQVAAVPMQKYGGQNSFKGGGEFLKALVKGAFKDVMKAGGESKSSSPQGETQEDFLNNRNNTFKSYLSNNAMYALALDEMKDLSSLHRDAMARCGGAYMQQGGQMSEEWMRNMGMREGQDNTPELGTTNIQTTPQFSFNTPDNNGMQPITSQMSSDQLSGQQGVNPQRSEFDLMSNNMQQTGFQNEQNNMRTQPQKNNWMAGNGQLFAEGIIGGMNFLSAGLNARNTRSNENLLKQRMSADNVFSVNQAGSSNRGEYDTNSGVFKPNQFTPVQNRGNMKFGGQHDEGEYMSEKEIRALKAQGYHVEYLD